MVPDQVRAQKLCFWPDNCEPSGPPAPERYNGENDYLQMTIILAFYA